MASEITYAEVKFKNESNSSESTAAPREKPVRHLSKPGSPSLPFTSLMVLLLLLAITFLVAFIIYFQKYSQLLEEKKPIKGVTYEEMNCIKNVSLKEGKMWSCCPKDWKPFGSHCYFPSTDFRESWNKSEENCVHMGAHLVVIHSQEEQDFLKKNLKTQNAYFIGLLDTGHRQWQWVDQTPYHKSVKFWHKGEPNSENEQCVILSSPRQEWGWNDIPCHEKQNSICQMKRIYL